MVNFDQLYKIREVYGDKDFYIAHIGNVTGDNITSVLPKKVTIRENLTVWDSKTGACIINGMQLLSFLHCVDSDAGLKEIKKSFSSQVNIALKHVYDYAYDEGKVKFLKALSEFNLKKLYKKL